MTTVKLEIELPYEINTVWNVVTDLENYAWRSDIKEIKHINENVFVEVSKDSIETTFKITTFQTNVRYEFDINNKNMSGHWSGRFEKKKDGTFLIFVEEVAVKHAIMKLFVKLFLKKQQKQYIEDLKNALSQKIRK